MRHRWTIPGFQSYKSLHLVLAIVMLASLLSYPMALPPLALADAPLILTVSDTTIYPVSGAPVIIAPTLTIAGGSTINGARVVLTTNFNSSQDALGIAGQSGTSGTVKGLGWAYIPATGVFTLSGTASVATYESALRLVTYVNSSGTPTIANRTVSFSLGTSLPCAANNHFYEFVSAPAITWFDALAAASSSTFFGLQGYLATVTSSAENICIGSKLQGQGWMGASDDPSQGTTEGDWRWVTGPEAGQQFWQGNGSGSAVAGRYNNWLAGEPNNAGNENFGHFFVDGTWNDYAFNNPVIAGYLVEYGGQAGDPPLQISGNATVVINTPPTITDPGARTINEDATTGALAFTIGDTESPASGLTVTASSSNTALVPNANLTLGGSNASHTIDITPLPNQNGTTNITLIVTDPQGASTQVTFTLTVTPVDDPPVNTVPAPQAAVEHTDTPIRGISVADIDAFAAPIKVTLSSGNGILTVNTTVANGLTAANISGNGTTQVVLNGTLNQINATLANAQGLIYNSSPGFTGTDSLTIVTDDLGNTGIGGPLSDTDLVPITVGAQADVQVIVRDMPSLITAGTTLAYTIVVTNTGPSAAANVVLSDTLTPGVTFNSIIPSTGTCSGTSPARCDFGTLAPNTSVTISVTAAVDSSFRGVAATIADATTSTPELNRANNRTTASSAIGGDAQLSLSVVTSSNPVVAGTLLTYTITVTNTGPSTSNGTLSGIVPSDATFQSVTTSSGTCTQITDVSCTLGDLSATGTATIILVVKVNPQVRAPLTTITSVKGIDSITTIAVVVTDVVAQAELRISSDDMPQTLAPGKSLTYHIQVHNNGPSTATGTTLAARLPTDATLVSVTPATGTCNSTTSIVCNLGTMLPDATTTITIVITLKGVGTATTTLSVIALEEDLIAVNNQLTLSALLMNYMSYLPVVINKTKVEAVLLPDLVVSQVALSPNATQFKAGESVVFSVTFTNKGQAASPAVWADLYLNPDPAPTAPNQPWNQRCGMIPCLGIVWRVPVIQPGASVTLTSSSDEIAKGYGIWPGWLAAGTTDVYVYVDSYKDGSSIGAAQESDETNNRAELHGLSVTGKNPPVPELSQLTTIPSRPDPDTYVP